MWRNLRDFWVETTTVDLKLLLTYFSLVHVSHILSLSNKRKIGKPLTNSSCDIFEINFILT